MIFSKSAQMIALQGLGSNTKVDVWIFILAQQIQWILQQETIAQIQEHLKMIQKVCSSNPGGDKRIFDEEKFKLIKIPFKCFADKVNFQLFLWINNE